MKIVFLQDDFPPHAKGGAGIVAASLARELAMRGHDLIIVTSVQDKSLIGSFQEDGMRIERIYSDYATRWRSWFSLYNPATVGRVKGVLAEVHPDVVHAHNVHYHLSYWSLRLAKRSGAKVFLTAHDVMLFHYGKLIENIPTDCESPRNYRVSALQQLRRYRLWYNPFRNFVIRRLLKNVNRIFAVSGALKQALTQNGIQNVSIMHNGINVVDWKVAPETVQAFVNEHGLDGKKVILFGGRISALKGGDVMLNALQQIVEDVPSAVLLLIGRKDVYVDRLLKRAKENGVGEHVISTGWITGDSLKAAYHASVIVVAPSQYLDPLPTTVLEAMACRKPVVGTCLGGIPEMVINGKSGYLTRPAACSELSEHILELLIDSKRIETFGAEGFQLLQKDFSAANWVETHESQFMIG